MPISLPITRIEGKRKLLIIAAFWPESNATASGVRNWGIIEACQKQDWQVVFASTAKENRFTQLLNEAGVLTQFIAPNDSAFDVWIANEAPDFVLLDQFLIEEQFSWRIRQHSPQTVRILDTQDLHFLRRGRQEAVKQGVALDRVFAADIELEKDETALRELASIYRSDHTLLVSDFEQALLTERFDVPTALLSLCRFFYPAPTHVSAIESRNHFVIIGNFRHPPNADGIRWFRSCLWPKIRKAIPKAQVHVYGAYCSEEFSQAHSEASGFLVKGQAADAVATLSQYLVNLAPLRFGAGIKGKIADGWAAGTPAVTTLIGAEGMSDLGQWGGLIAHSESEFIDAAIHLYQDDEQWRVAQANGFRLLKQLFDKDVESEKLITVLLSLSKNTESIRAKNSVGSLLWHQTLRSTEYFSRWIELKQLVASTRA